MHSQQKLVVNSCWMKLMGLSCSKTDASYLIFSQIMFFVLWLVSWNLLKSCVFEIIEVIFSNFVSCSIMASFVNRATWIDNHGCDWIKFSWIRFMDLNLISSTVDQVSLLRLVELSLQQSCTLWVQFPWYDESRRRIFLPKIIRVGEDVSYLLMFSLSHGRNGGRTV